MYFEVDAQNHLPVGLHYHLKQCSVSGDGSSLVLVQDSCPKLPNFLGLRMQSIVYSVDS